MLLVDLRRPALGRGGPSLVAKPCRELGRVWPAAAGDAGLLELGDALGGDTVSVGDRGGSGPPASMCQPRGGALRLTAKSSHSSLWPPIRPGFSFV